MPEISVHSIAHQSILKGVAVCAHDDIYTNGECRTCDREKQARYRRRRRLGMELLRSAEARGLSGYAALALLQNADPVTIESCQAKGIR